MSEFSRRRGLIFKHPMSRWVTEQLPKKCANADCPASFTGAAFKGFRTGNLYCSRHCRSEMSDEMTTEDAARAVE